jgi:hypothetical protein
MTGLSEVEIFDCMIGNFRSAAEKCEQLAWHPRRGFVYNAMRKELKLAEGACRQAAAHREDARWLSIGMAIEHAHKRAGTWIRGLPSKDGRKVAHPLFLKLAESLRKLANDAEILKNRATGRVGMILPEPLPGPHRDTRPVSVRLPSGLIVPAGHA